MLFCDVEQIEGTPYLVGQINAAECWWESGGRWVVFRGTTTSPLDLEGRICIYGNEISFASREEAVAWIVPPPKPTEAELAAMEVDGW